MMRSGANLGLSSCPQEGLDPDNGTELGTLETELAREDEEGGGPTAGPDFRAAEQSSRAQFQIFPVSLGGRVRHRGSHTWSRSLSCLLFIFPRMASHHPNPVDKYLSTDTAL